MKQGGGGLKRLGESVKIMSVAGAVAGLTFLGVRGCSAEAPAPSETKPETPASTPSHQAAGDLACRMLATHSGFKWHVDAEITGGKAPAGSDVVYKVTFLHDSATAEGTTPLGQPATVMDGRVDVLRGYIEVGGNPNKILACDPSELPVG
jgi:hypothetical protein